MLERKCWSENVEISEARNPGRKCRGEKSEIREAKMSERKVQDPGGENVGAKMLRSRRRECWSENVEARMSGREVLRPRRHRRFKMLYRTRLIKSEHLDSIKSAGDASRIFDNGFGNRLAGRCGSSGTPDSAKHNGIPYFFAFHCVCGFQVPDDAPRVSDNALVIDPRRLVDYRGSSMLLWGWKTQWICMISQAGTRT